MRLNRAGIPVWLGIAVITLVVLTAMPPAGLREIHHADRISNFALVEPRPHADDWPLWRGIDGRNVSPSNRFPERWSTDSSTKDSWQIEVPGTGSSSPIIWGEQLFLVTSEVDSQRVALRNYDRSTGREKWWTTLHKGVAQKSKDQKPHLLPTPACDGQFVYTVIAKSGALWVTSVDFSGHVVWSREAGPADSLANYSSSPALYQSLIIVVADRDRDGYIAALHRQTGEIIWRIQRSDGENFASPIIATIAGRPQLVVSGKKTIASYNPSTGEPLWTYRGLTDTTSNCIAYDNDHVFGVIGRKQAEIICVRADGSGDVTETHLVWSQPKSDGQNLSPVCHGGWLYALAEDGLLRCIDATNGKTEWRRRLTGTFSASPIIAGDRLICCNEQGTCTLIQAGSSNTQIAENVLLEGAIVSPIVSGNCVVVRTISGLSRFAAPAPEPLVERPERSKRRL